jgi:hypothetical protein
LHRTSVHDADDFAPGDERGDDDPAATDGDAGIGIAHCEVRRVVVAKPEPAAHLRATEDLVVGSAALVRELAFVGRLAVHAGAERAAQDETGARGFDEEDGDALEPDALSGELDGLSQHSFHFCAGGKLVYGRKN